MVNLLLLLVMIAALVGMVFCNRKQRKDTKFQLIALVLLVVVIASGGMFMCRLDTLTLLGFSNNSNQSADFERKLNESQGYVVANFIKNSYSGKTKVLVIAPKGTETTTQALLAELHEKKVGALVQEKLALGGVPQGDKLITPVADHAAESRSIDAAIDRHKDARVVILVGISPSGEALKRLKVYRQSYESRPRLIILGLTNLTDWTYKQLQNGYFDALVVTDLTKAIPDNENLPENLIEVFNSRYVLIHTNNLRRNRRFFH